jgi:hypothetical protein
VISVKENDFPSHIDNGVIKDEIISVEIKEKGSYKKPLNYEE